MKTTFLLQDDLYQQAVRATGITQKTKLLHLGLEALVREAAAERLAQLKGAIPKARAPQRRRDGMHYRGE